MRDYTGDRERNIIKTVERLFSHTALRAWLACFVNPESGREEAMDACSLPTGLHPDPVGFKWVD
jgi:hypothetical protein